MAKTITHNFNIKSKEIKKYAKKMSRKILKDTLFASLEHVGQISVKDYMRPTSQEGAISGGEASTSKILSVRSGRLAGSIVGNWRFSKVNLPKTVERYVEGKVSATGQGFEGGKQESIRQVKVNPGSFEGVIGSKVEYAILQEKGGMVHPTVTAKSRAFFWRMFRETGIERWKNMAMSRKDKFDVKIRARPYLTPAVKDSRPQVLRIFKEAIQATWDRERI